jgi:hypothetical protein
MTYPCEWKSRTGIEVTCPRPHWSGTIPNVNLGPRTWQYRGDGARATCPCGGSVKVPRQTLGGKV